MADRVRKTAGIVLTVLGGGMLGFLPLIGVLVGACEYGWLLLAGKLGPRLDERKLQKAAIVLFILGGMSIIMKSVLFHT